MNQRVRLSKILLKHALTQMLQEQNIYQISIRDLCRRAGINRSTFYKYYGNQFDLLTEMEQDLLGEITAVLTHENDGTCRPLEQVLEYLESNMEFVRLLFNSNVDPEFPGKLFSLPPIQQMLRRFSAEGDYAMNFLLYGGFQVVKLWVNKERDRESAEQMAEIIWNLLLKSDR